MAKKPMMKKMGKKVAKTDKAPEKSGKGAKIGMMKRLADKEL
jgi:hypothetical protein